MRIDLGGWALLLIAIGIGYLICLKASKEGTKLFKHGGYIVGIIILIVSLVLAVCDIGNRISRRRRAAQRRSRSRTVRPVTRSRQQLPKRDVGVPETEKTPPETAE